MGHEAFIFIVSAAYYANVRSSGVRESDPGLERQAHKGLERIQHFQCTPCGNQGCQVGIFLVRKLKFPKLRDSETAR